MKDLFGNEVPVAGPRPLTLPELARLRHLGLLDRTECNGTHYQYGCCCPACEARARHAEEFGYDAAGRLNPRPQPKQPWDVEAA